MTERAAEPVTEGDPLHILFICTANRCRSPLAQVIASDQIRRRGADAVVSSAGFMESGQPAASGSINAARKRGLDLSRHASNEIDADLIAWADVVIGMEPGHILDLSDIVPGAQKRALTLKELARFAKGADDGPMSTVPLSARPRSTDQIREWVRHVGERSLSSLLSDDNTVEDPIGRSDRRFRSTAKEIDGLITTVFDLWFGPQQ